MNELLIDIPSDHYRPGDTIKGEILWSVDHEPGSVNLTLGWWTEGRGTKDAKQEEVLTWEGPGVAGKEPFSIKLPPSPCSFSGTLITLQWALELSIKPGKQSVSRNIAVSHGEEPVKLKAIDGSDKKPVSLKLGR